MHGFAEREGTEVHAQLFVPGFSDESGATTTHMVSDFDEGPVKFDSTHSVSVPLSTGKTLEKAFLRVSIFAKITTMHLEKLISWDDMRDQVVSSPVRKAARISETEFYTEERHDVFARVQILELAETGEYLPVDVVQTSDTDIGTFQLHQGLQRRVQIGITHNSGDALKWENIDNIHIGQVRLLDPRGKIPDLTSTTREVPLNVVLGPVIKSNADGTSTVTVVAQWDSSLHNSILLDRTTAAGYRVQMTLRWNVASPQVSEPMGFSMDIFGQIQSRLSRSSSKLMQYWNNTRIVRASAGVFSLVIRPAAARRVGDLWRMNTLHRYVKGEEYLNGWTPRGVSLVRDYLTAKKRRTRVAEVETAKGFLSRRQAQAANDIDTIAERSTSSDGTNSPDVAEPIVDTQSDEEPTNPSISEGPIDGEELQESGPAESTDIKNLEIKPESKAAENPSSTDSLEAEEFETTITEPDVSTNIAEDQSREEQLLRKFLSLWSSIKDPSEVMNGHSALFLVHTNRG